MRPIRWLRRGITLVGLGVAGGAVLVTARHLLETPQPLQSGLPGEGRIDRKHGGDVYYSILGPETAEPVVLLHDFYPGASSYEYRHIFPRFAADYRVYAPDWLGFGMSEHPALAYTGEFYANMLAGFLRDVVGRPAHLIAHGRAANIAVRVASDVPELVNRLVLVSPYTRAGFELDPSLGQALARTAQRTSLGLVPYAVLSSRPVLSLSLRGRSPQTAADGDRDAALGHLYASAHQFGGQHALTALLTGELDLPIQNAFALLVPPVLVVGGERDPRHLPEEMEDLAILNPHADLDIIADAGDAAFEDQPAAFVESTRGWLQSARLRHEPGEADFLPPFSPEAEADAEALAAAEPELVVVMEPTEADEAEQLQEEALLAEVPVEVVIVETPEEEAVLDEAEAASEPATGEDAWTASTPAETASSETETRQAAQAPERAESPEDEHVSRSAASRETDDGLIVPVLTEKSRAGDIGTEGASEPSTGAATEQATEQPTVKAAKSRTETSSRQAPRRASARREPPASNETRKRSGAKDRGAETRSAEAGKKRQQRKTHK
jgi:pimeloyl-ACP methyl ester carboxylesterase